MSSPQILSTTVGISLPSFTIAKDLSGRVEHVQTTKLSTKVPRPVAARSGRRSLSVFVPVLLVVANVLLFGLYLFNVNNLQGLSFNLRTEQRSLAQLQDKQRQYQVQIAEASAVVRAQEVNAAEGRFVALGTPEFVTQQVSSTVSMQ